MKSSKIGDDNSITSEWKPIPDDDPIVATESKKLTKDQIEIIEQRNAIPFIQNINVLKFGWI